MTWKNETETVTKCTQCGKFCHEGDCFYGLASSSYDCSEVIPFCDKGCNQKYMDREAQSGLK